MTLYTMDVAYETLMAELCEPQWEDETDEQYAERMQGVLDTMEGIELEHADKVQGYVFFVKNMEASIAELTAQAEIFKAEVERINKIVKTRTNLLNRTKDVVAQSIIDKGLKNVKTDLFTVGTRKSAQTVVDVDAEALPDELRKVKYEANKTAIKKYIEETGDETFGHMETHYSLTIR